MGQDAEMPSRTEWQMAFHIASSLKVASYLREIQTLLLLHSWTQGSRAQAVKGKQNKMDVLRFLPTASHPGSRAQQREAACQTY